MSKGQEGIRAFRSGKFHHGSGGEDIRRIRCGLWNRSGTRWCRTGKAFYGASCLVELVDRIKTLLSTPTPSR
jgi:hypothetical protein